MKQMVLLTLYLIILLSRHYGANTIYDLSNLHGFRCHDSTKLPYAIRLNSNNMVQCFSMNGQTCNTLKTESICRDFIAANNKRVKTIECQESQTKIEGHWCNQSHNYFFKQWHCQNETGIQTGIKLDPITGHSMCISFNGKDCLWGKKGRKVCNKLPHCKKTQERIKPLRCGDDHKTFWGNTGYNFPSTHWCKKAFAFFKFNDKWYHKSQTGISTLIKLESNGDVSCISQSGKDCIWGINDKYQANAIERKLSGIKSLRSITCGKKLKKYTGKTGFENINHWCSKSIDGIFNGKFNPKGSSSTNTNNNPKGYSSTNTNNRPKKPNKIIWGGQKWIRHMIKKFGKDWKIKIKQIWGKDWRNSLKLYWKKINKKLTESRKQKPNGDNWRQQMVKKFGKDWKNIFKNRYGDNWKNRVEIYLKRKKLIKPRRVIRGSKTWIKHMEKHFGKDWKITVKKRWGTDWKIRLKKYWTKINNSRNSPDFTWIKKRWINYLIKNFGKNWKEIVTKHWGEKWKTSLIKYCEKKDRERKNVPDLRWMSKTWRDYMIKKFGPDWKALMLKKWGKGWVQMLKRFCEEKDRKRKKTLRLHREKNSRIKRPISKRRNFNPNNNKLNNVKNEYHESKVNSITAEIMNSANIMNPSKTPDHNTQIGLKNKQNSSIKEDFVRVNK